MVGGPGEMNVNHWKECLELGNKYEGPIRERIEHFIMSLVAKNISYEKHPILQKNGIDILTKKEYASFDLKVRSKEKHMYYNKDIGFEERTSMETKWDIKSGTDGWFRKKYQEYVLEKNNGGHKRDHIIVYIWETKTGHNVEPIGYIIPLTPELFKWYEKIKYDYDSKPAFSKDDKSGEYWWTLNRYIPIEKIPSNFLFKFNPRICLIDKTKQKTLFRSDN
jgi:hypothetical protein